VKHYRKICILLLALATPCALGQEEPDPATPKTEQAGQESNKQPEASPQPPPQEPEGSASSPFDYRSSEQISEDLSVSFPVDI
jgi:hypothetical protein